jgi:hypothetical protein
MLIGKTNLSRIFTPELLVCAEVQDGLIVEERSRVVCLRLRPAEGD